MLSFELAHPPGPLPLGKWEKQRREGLGDTPTAHYQWAPAGGERPATPWLYHLLPRKYLRPPRLGHPE